jgi:hypothetical protein
MVTLLSYAAGQGPQAKYFVLRAPNTALRFDLPELEKLIDQTILEGMEKEHLPGVAFTLVKDGVIIFSRV